MLPLHHPIQATLRALLLTCGALAPVHPATAQPPDGWVPVASDTLDSQRGGFAMPDGLMLSLGIDRLVAINGQLVAHTSINIPDLASMTAAQIEEADAALSSVKLIQNGSGNVYQAALSNQTMGGTIIQNTLNDQQIASATLIRASVNSSDLLSTLHFHGNVADAIARGAGP